MIIFDVYVFVFGLIIGSFLNVCIVRMPDEKSVVKPRSHCQKCKKMIPWYDNIPLVSYLFLGGKCRYCKAKFSFLYFFVELLTAVTFLLFYKYYGFSKLLIPYLVMVSGFIVATMVDFKHRIIPDEISIGGMYAGMFFSCFVLELHDLSSEVLMLGRFFVWGLLGMCFVLNAVLKYLDKIRKNEIDSSEHDAESRSLFIFIFGLIAFDGVVYIILNVFNNVVPSSISPYLLGLDASIIGLLVGGGMIYGMGLIGDILFNKEAMGGGDVKLMAMVGAFLGWKAALLSFFIAPFFGAVFGIIEKIRTNDTAIAYGPFLVLGALISLFYGDWLIVWIQNGYNF